MVPFFWDGRAIQSSRFFERPFIRCSKDQNHTQTASKHQTKHQNHIQTTSKHPNKPNIKQRQNTQTASRHPNSSSLHLVVLLGVWMLFGCFVAPPKRPLAESNRCCRVIRLSPSLGARYVVLASDGLWDVMSAQEAGWTGSE